MKTRILLTLCLVFGFVVPVEAIGSRRGGGGGGGGHKASRPSSSHKASKPRPSNKGQYRPQTKPSTREASRPSRPSTKPATRPSLPDKKPDLGNRPDKPTTLPGKLPDKKPDRPNIGDRPGGADRPNIGDRPGGGDRPNIGDRPGGGDRPNKPGFGDGGRVPDRPGSKPRPQRPEWDQKFKDRDTKFTNNSDKWFSDNNITINKFENNRNNRWNNIDNKFSKNDWHNHWGDNDFKEWRRDTWNYRGDRCREIWHDTYHYHYHDHFFNTHWWGYCHWYPRPIIYTNCSPWWWWRPVAWTTFGYFFGQAIASQPVVYDPGTTVIYEGDTVYVNGESAGNAAEYRKETIELANPELAETPMPGPPQDGSAENDDPTKPTGDWLPVGVWALTQQKEGDATMFMQLSIDKQGIVAGAYKNVMTGDEQPIAGKVDLKSQRVAWHVGDVKETVYETGLSNLENDVASVFVHFGEDQTQTWLLVRMPSPEMPPGTVKLPEIADTDKK